MTKREALILTVAGSLATSGVGRYEDHYARAERLVDEVLKEQAHELAEVVRKFPDSPAGHAADWWDAATIPEAIADHIDPEVP